jgi:hypothetical protein
MNESRTYSATGSFDPPEEGLMPGESIAWTRRAGTGFWLVFFGFIIVIGGPAVLFGVIQELSSPLAFLFAILVAAGIIGEISLFIRTKRTRYYWTVHRVSCHPQDQQSANLFNTNL